MSVYAGVFSPRALFQEPEPEPHGFVRVLPKFEPTIVPVWLVTHREVHTSQRVRLVFDLKANKLARVYGG